jgi:thiamine biosynthesis lipoprotein ApbE/Na+-translocating ferredoxin:NAD+ oxidoreductase RnfG subunit
VAASPDNREAIASGRELRSRLTRRTWRQWIAGAVAPRLVRLGLLACAAVLIYFAGRQPPPPDDISLADARAIFPTAARLTAGDVRLGGQTVLDESGETLGLLLTTSPHTDDIVGYSGPSNLLVALDPQMQIVAVRILSSGDTDSHVDRLRSETRFWQQFVGKGQSDQLSPIEGISGSTLTSLAMGEAVERRLRGSAVSLRFAEPVKLREIRKLMKPARRFEADTPRPGWNKVWDGEGKHLGFVVRTSPYSDNVRGYQGPTESLVALGPDGKSVIGILIRKSYDTELYVERVRPDEDFHARLVGRSIEDWSKIDFAKEGIEGVSGATQTSFAVADGIRRRFAADLALPPPKPIPWARHAGLTVIIVGALVLTFTRLRTSRRLRTLWQIALVIAFAFWLGDLLSIALFVGWSRNGVSWPVGLSPLLLTAVALLVPWGSRRQIYCQSICPHGAAQNLLGRFKRLHISLPPGVQRWLAYVPRLLLATSLVLAVFYIRFDLASLEPFDGWVLKTASLTSFILGVAGLLASVFIPQAYCRFGCPTGELLQLMKSGGSHDRLTWRDSVVAILLATAAGLLFAPQLSAYFASADVSPAESLPQEFGGKAFGTNWTVKVRGAHDPEQLRSLVATELERIENLLSHWRPGSATSQFNSSETTLEMEQPAELVELVSFALDLHRESQGKYDITIAPLLDAWGFGPAGQMDAPPSDDDITATLAHVGSDKLLVDRAANTLRKRDPQLKIDLGSLLQGYAADRIGQLLGDQGVTEYLVDVGGELVARGTWNVAIEDPTNAARPLRTIPLTDAALATSGTYRAAKKLGNIPAHHLLSPQTGRPVKSSATQCAVIAPTALAADGWATALLAVGPDQGKALAKSHNLTVFYVTP